MGRILRWWATVMGLAILVFGAFDAAHVGLTPGKVLLFAAAINLVAWALIDPFQEEDDE